MSEPVHWNAPRFEPHLGHGHVESYFVKANDPKGQKALWLKATVFAPQGRPLDAVAEAWAIIFDRQKGHIAVKQSLAYSETLFSADPFRIVLGPLLELGSEGSRGEIALGKHQVRWQLNWNPSGEPLVMFPAPWMYSGPFPSSKLVSPMPDLRVSGLVWVDDQELFLDSWKGMQGHNWGRGHAHRYAWGHCNQWEGGEALVVEAASAQLAVGPVQSPLLTLFVVRHGQDTYAFNSPVDWAKNESELYERRWFFRGRNRLVSIECDVSVHTPDLVGLYYPNPDGAMTYCLNSKLAHARLFLQRQGEPSMVLSSRAAAFELGTRDPSHGVPMLV